MLVVRAAKGWVVSHCNWCWVCWVSGRGESELVATGSSVVSAMAWQRGGIGEFGGEPRVVFFSAEVACLCGLAVRESCWEAVLSVVRDCLMYYNRVQCADDNHWCYGRLIESET